MQSRRQRRTFVRPYGQSITGMRVVSLIMALAILAVIYNGVREPARWRWLAGHAAPRAGEASANQPIIPAGPETIVPGPNDLDPEAVAKITTEFERVLDRRPLQSFEMPAYWRLMAWSRTQPLKELSQRAARDVAITRLWEQPEKYRGKLIELHLHVRRVLTYPATKNDFGIENVYEVWGWTDESRSAPYVVVLPELPAGLPVGTDIRAEILFVGYFLKTMAYQAVESPRSSPLLVGRAVTIGPVASAPSSSLTTPAVVALFAGAGALLVVAIIWFQWQSRTRKRRPRVDAPLVLPDASTEEAGEHHFDFLRAPTNGDDAPTFPPAGDDPPLEPDSPRRRF